MSALSYVTSREGGRDAGIGKHSTAAPAQCNPDGLHSYHLLSAQSAKVSTICASVCTDAPIKFLAPAWVGGIARDLNICLARL